MRPDVTSAEKTAAIQEAVREALLHHALLGDPVAVGEPDGTVIWLTPMETLAEVHRQEAALGLPLSKVPLG